MNDIKEDMNSLEENMINLSEDFNSVKGDLTSLNETVGHLSGDLEQHKNQTTSILADIQVLDSKVVSGMISQLSTKLDEIDSSVNTSVSEAFNFSVSLVSEIIDPLNSKLVSVDSTVELMRGDLRFMKEKLSDFSGDHKNQTASLVADLQSSINKSHTEQLNLIHDEMESALTEKLTHTEDRLVNQLDDLDSKLVSVNTTSELMRGDLRSIKGQLTSLTETLSHLSGDLEQHKNQTTSILADIQVLYSKLVFGMINELSQLSTNLDELDSSVNASISEAFNFSVSLVSNIIDPLNSKLVAVDSTVELMRGDFRFVKEKLNHLCGDLWEHKNQTASVVADLQSLDSKLTAVGISTTEEIISLENQLSTKVDEQRAYITADLKSFINMSHTELLSLIHNDMEFEQMVNKKTCVEESEINSEIQQNHTHQLNNSDENTPPPPIHTCGGTGGWRRAVHLDMTDPNTNCPRGWNITNYSNRTCGRPNDGTRTCNSATYSVSGGEYSQVCGRIKAYQWGWTAGFFGYYSGFNTVDRAYVSGVAVMHGSPRQHIWSFVAGVAENYPGGNHFYLCPCDGIISDRLAIPPFVGEDYFCESGYIYPGQWINDEIEQLHFNDTLWDGRDCHSSSTCCSRRNPPYFTKTLNTPTTDDIELRMCHYFQLQYENIAIELVEVYVK